MSEFECERCGVSIDLNEDHTEIIRRDFVEKPQPSQVEHLCSTCWDDYETFLEGA